MKKIQTTHYLRTRIFAGIIITSAIRLTLQHMTLSWYIAWMVIVAIAFALLAHRKARKDANHLFVLTTQILAIFLLGIAFWILPSDCAHGFNGIFLVPGVISLILLQSSYCEATGDEAEILQALVVQI